MLFKISLGITICHIKNTSVLNPLNVTCGHSYKLVKELIKLDVKNFLASRVINFLKNLDNATLNS